MDELVVFAVTCSYCGKQFVVCRPDYRGQSYCKDVRSSLMAITETSASRSPKSPMAIAGAAETVISGYLSLSVSSGLRFEGPFSTSRWALWMRRSQIASA